MKDRKGIAYRRKHTQRVIKNRLKLLKLVGDKVLLERMSTEKNRLDKKKPYDCGVSKCPVCSSGKVNNQRKHSELKKLAELKEKEKE